MPESRENDALTPRGHAGPLITVALVASSAIHGVDHGDAEYDNYSDFAWEPAG
jgi:hypothetical protein